MQNFIVEMFAICIVLALGCGVFFLLLNLRQASQERGTFAQQYKRAHDLAEAERRFTTRRQIKTVQRKFERKAKKVFAARKGSNNRNNENQIEL